MKLAILLILFSGSLFAGPGSLGGTVRLPGGEAISGASVYVTHGNKTLVTVSDLDGKYHFELEAGDYEIQAWSGNLNSKSGAFSIKAGTESQQNLELAATSGEIPVSLKISPLDRPGFFKTIQLKFAPSPLTWPPLESEPLQSALADVDDGDYEVLVSRPGSVFVGTCRVYSAVDGSKRILQIDGLEISGEDYVHALALQNPVQMGALKSR